MYFIELPDIDQQKLSFYLSAEEYLATKTDKSPLFFMWQVKPTVIIGRNQNIDTEVNLPYCRDHGIDVFRRKSGGGCVYADLGNVMLCYISDGPDVGQAFSTYITLMSAALRRSGFNVVPTGRNDLTINGNKVSGSAFYHTGGRNIVHSTLLYDTNFDNMVSSITPPKMKLEAKGVDSVRSRITLLKYYTDKSLGQIKSEIRAFLCGDRSIRLTEQDIANIREIEKTYLDPEFFWGKRKHWTIEKKGRVEGCGDIFLHFFVRRGIIESVEIEGDWFENGEVRHFSDALAGTHMDEDDLRRRLERIPPEDYISGLTGKELLRLIFG